MHDIIIKRLGDSCKLRNLMGVLNVSAPAVRSVQDGNTPKVIPS